VSAENNGRWKRWPVAFVSQALRYNSMMPGNGCVRASSGLAVASRHAGCCNWRICCALRLHAADAGKAQRRFILISPAARCQSCGHDTAAGFSLDFSCTEFVLYESQFAGGRLRYTALNRWTLKHKKDMSWNFSALRSATLIQRYKRFLPM
jgi:hypothetical protein